MEILVIWNVIVFALYGIDKHNAIHKKWRISERKLLLMAFFMGGAGAFLGMQFFRHKTKHLKFTVGVPLMMLLNLGAVYLLGRVNV
ncbi:MAG: DUF1294 domain-containing protein [Clostridia bacterium]|nr:DUF1294 domain-containing protein [Clostridia bacterium]MBR0277444.1 DUF1294 domain-containing protein [Clostridia bacterium]